MYAEVPFLNCASHLSFVVGHAARLHYSGA